METIINTNLSEEEEVKYEESVLLLTLRQLDYLENPRKRQKNRKDFKNTFPISSVIPYPPPRERYGHNKDDIIISITSTRRSLHHLHHHQ